MTQQGPMQHSQAGIGGDQYGQSQGYGQTNVGQQGGIPHGGRRESQQEYGQQGMEYGQQGTGQQMGRQEIGQQGQIGGQQGQTGGQGMGQTGGQQLTQPGGQFDDQLPGEMRVALEDFEKAAKVCDWCADKCIDEGPQMAECIRLCRDVSDLGTLNAKLIARDSVFGPELAEVFANAAEECASECMRHQNPHCQECASVLSRAVGSTYRLLDQLQTMEQGTTMQQGGTQQGIPGQQSQF
ncbi:four-helix bundle copper-binding protein [Haladaptatus sp. CMAA 1911]|uniref:four-helix bundle copper-binding protein n=1 Tax=unclassified Haladaptatus TaxID=2622732 RepID=UPI0037540F5A